MKLQFMLIPLLAFGCNNATNTDKPLRIDSNQTKVPVEAVEQSEQLSAQTFLHDLGVERGTIVVMDFATGKKWYVNKQMSQTQFVPMSSFKICNSLIGLETGVIPDESYVIKWDRKKREQDIWNQDLSLRLAFKFSAYWYYQELAKRVGAERMKTYLDKIGYGNRDTSGGIDLFWIGGGLRISAEQQVAFLKRLYENKLPLSQRSIDIVKKIMILDQKDDYQVRAKTGSGPVGKDSKEFIGWYVGYTTQGQKNYGFAVCIFGDSFDFVRSRRIKVTQKVLADVCGIPNVSLR